MKTELNPLDQGKYDKSQFETFVLKELMPYYRQCGNGGWGYVCPCCGTTFPPKCSSMPDGFRAHIKEYLAGGGCMFNPSQGWKKRPNNPHDPKVAGF